ncbi:bis(5'-nucleosyl)-tetraphosphatase PrpE [asymmetrical]-like [Lineus longissimus]|uniref:bis(5'-nucleosyl)-tetraphosphatase PrpE [asymmetrical]-like n=1 Tax=Lineus longissimus TaxID=88925 RepID=UPI002B4C6836
MTTYGVLSYIEAKRNKSLPVKKKDIIIDLLKDEPMPFRDPKVMHRVITDAECEGKEVLIIGDVHGCLEELKDLLVKCDLLEDGVVRDGAIVILCGDIVMKGPLNVETLRYMKHAGILAVRGNQDDKCILRYTDKVNGIPFMTKNLWMEGLTADDIEVLLDLPYSISIPSVKTVIVHAGVFPGVPLEEQNRFVLTYMRSIHSKNGTLAPSPATVKEDEDQPWAKLWRGPYHVYFGHDARHGLQQWDFATGLDTGCVYGKKMTGKFVAGRRQGEFISVDARNTYWKV